MTSQTDSRELHPKARATVERIQVEIQSGRMPMVNQIVRIIRDISSKEDKLSIVDLADVVSSEPSTMARIIAIAGTLGYNPSGVEIMSLQHAVAVIGFDRVRNLAISLLLLESAQSQSTAELNRELAGVALVGGLFAKEMCRRTLSADPELAFVCGALRNYGRMLMATFLPEDYYAAIEHGGGSKEDESFRSVFGLTPLELGHELLASMELPSGILDTLVAIPAEVRKRTSEYYGPALATVADMGLRLAEVIEAPDLTPENVSRRMEDLSREYDEAFHITPDFAKELLGGVAATMGVIRSKGGGVAAPVVAFQRLDSLALHRRLPPPFKPAHKAPASRAPVPPSAPALPADQVAQTSRLLEAGITEVERMVHGPNPDVQCILALLVRVLQEALSLDGCVIFLKDRQGEWFRVVQGAGPLFEKTRQVVLDPAKRDVFSVCLKRGEDALLENPDNPPIRPFVPEWLRPPGRVLPVLLLPIVGEAGPFALVCATSTSLLSFGLVAKVLGELRRLRTLLRPLGRLE